MKKFSELYDLNEDSQHAGYKETLETPRSLGPEDYIFVDINEGRSIGHVILNYQGIPIEGTKILQNNERLFQYAHYEEESDEVHIESVEMFRNLWNSIHIPQEAAGLIADI